MPYQYQISGGKCAMCGEPFEDHHRYNKTTCSNLCRQKLKRLTDGIESKFETALDIIEFYSSIEVADLQNHAIEKLKIIKEIIESTLAEIETGE